MYYTVIQKTAILVMGGSQFDKEGNELKDGNVVVFDSGREQKLYLTTEGQLGTDATNPKWLETGRACECEYGIYVLNDSDMQEIILKK